MSQSSSSSGWRKPDVLLTVGDIPKKDLSGLPLVGCTYCKDRITVEMRESKNDHGAYYMICPRYKEKFEKKTCYFYRWLHQYVQLLDDTEAPPDLLRRIKELYREKEEIKLQETQMNSPENVMHQQLGKEPRMNMASGSEVKKLEQQMAQQVEQMDTLAEDLRMNMPSGSEVKKLEEQMAQLVEQMGTLAMTLAEDRRMNMTSGSEMKKLEEQMAKLVEHTGTLARQLQAGAWLQLFMIVVVLAALAALGLLAKE